MGEPNWENVNGIHGEVQAKGGGTARVIPVESRGFPELPKVLQWLKARGIELEEGTGLELIYDPQEDADAMRREGIQIYEID